jgi:hypothetical protein
VLKPDVVFFGELLPRAAIDRAYELARARGLLLVVGSSLEVYPVADLPLETLGCGGSFAIVNRGPTALDREAELKVDGAAGETLREGGDGFSGDLARACGYREYGKVDRRASSGAPLFVTALGRGATQRLSPRTCRQDEQVLRSTSYGIPAR